MQRPVQITRMPKSDFVAMIIDYDRRKKERILPAQLPLDKLSKYVAERSATDASVPVPECVTCGVCCNFALIAPVSREDSERHGEYVEITLDGWDGNAIAVDRALKRNEETGSCLHLGGELGHEVSCQIYDRRPQVCHDFDAGSDRCHEYRRMYGVEPQLSESDREAAIVKLDAVQAKRKRVIEDAVIVLDSVVHRSTYTDAGVETYKTAYLKVVVFLDDETPHEIHEYYADEESWFESDFLNLSLEEATAMVSEPGAMASG
jgi:Fe-S-cluster containining protein